MCDPLGHRSHSMPYISAVIIQRVDLISQRRSLNYKHTTARYSTVHIFVQHRGKMS